jgi:hypothetical protein
VLKKYENTLSWVFGIGIVSFAFRNYFYSGIMIGLVLCIAVLFITTILIINDKDRPKNILGSKWVWVPLLIICLSIVTAGIANFTTSRALFTDVIIAASFFGTYLICRILGDKVFKPFSIAVVIEAASVVLYSLVLHYGIHNGGWASYRDYNVADALMVIGAIVSVGKKQWWIVTITLIGVFFTGAEEGLLALAIILVVVFIRRDVSWRLALSVGIVAVIAVLGLKPFNYTTDLYAMPIDQVTELVSHHHNPQAVAFAKIESNDTGLSAPDLHPSTIDYISNSRWQMALTAFRNWNWLGSGYVMNPVDSVNNAIYNVPLVVAQQVGVWAALAWLFVVFFCLIKTKWKYAFVALLAFALMDNLIFCQLGLWMFALAGVSTVSVIKSDLMFKRANG